MWQQPKLHEFCKSRGIHLYGYSPLGSQSAKTKETGVLAQPVVKTVAEKLGKSPAQVAWHWGLEMGHSVLPKACSEARLKENLDIFYWSIPEDFLGRFSEIKQEKFVKPADMVNEKSVGYKTLEELWDEEV